jgi:hypothetical protein
LFCFFFTNMIMWLCNYSFSLAHSLPILLLLMICQYSIVSVCFGHYVFDSFLSVLSSSVVLRSFHSSHTDKIHNFFSWLFYKNTRKIAWTNNKNYRWRAIRSAPCPISPALSPLYRNNTLSINPKRESCSFISTAVVGSNPWDSQHMRWTHAGRLTTDPEFWKRLSNKLKLEDHTATFSVGKLRSTSE